jgi:hypothetical protein
MRRLLVAACAAMALALACVTGELRGAGAVDDEAATSRRPRDTFEALPAVAGVEPPPPPPAAGLRDLHFPRRG